MYSIDMKKSEELALLLGMFVGDGCLPIKHNGQGYRNYQISFYNTNKDYVYLFHKLFFDLFDIKGKIFCAYRKNKKPLWRFEIYSKKLSLVFNKEFEIPFGKKAKKVFIPSFIKNSSVEIRKYFLLGYLITDGGIRADSTVIFHCASEKLIDDLRRVLSDIWAINKLPKCYEQRGFLSYQLNLNKEESCKFLKSMPGWPNLVRRRF